MAGRCAAMLLAALAAAPPPAAAFLHPVASELCRTQAVSSGIAANMASGAPAGVLPDIARLCGAPAEAEAAVCPGDFQWDTGEFRAATANSALWPLVDDPGGEASRRAGSTHASGFRGVPGIPSAQSTTTVRRGGDMFNSRSSPAVPISAGSPFCASSRRNASRMGAIALRGEVALLVESWYIPTTFVPPCCANQLYRWRMSLASSDLRFRRPRCPGSFHKVPHPYVTSDAYVANDFLRSSQLGSIVSVTEPATPSQLAEVARNPPSTPNTSLRVPFPTTPAEDPTSSPLDPPGGSDEDPIRMFNDRPHQYFTLLVANLSSLGAILGPDSPDWSRPVPPGTTSVAFPPDALPWNSSSMSPSLSALTRFSTFFDGTTASGLCYYEKANYPFQNSPPWQPPIYSLLQRRGHPLRTCYGGHNSSCDVFSLDCGIVGRVQYAIDARDAHARYCAPDTILGSLQPSHISSRAHSWWQMGYSPLNVWYKPCEACGPMAAVRAGANRTELPECDIASCVANITRVVQRRVVAPWTVPSPGSLAALREADEGAFPWYACRSSARKRLRKQQPRREETSRPASS
ncbi:hypothetical protein FNF29_00945 [Cafeteria roenbergensis]|uniref:Uncharacterized protein n=1 Tax=Cafeteria roenbergensis TaxID=33653 RepID=A0A5A8CV02_CAFRO|nr:hypothetical protein FNF29_00945 [Cafeteria roenbergensis]|eukprot:KAA0156835.1 hypothetical protein FNF29_00945 [Cafeteria roenbergensis]